MLVQPARAMVRGQWRLPKLDEQPIQSLRGDGTGASELNANGIATSVIVDAQTVTGVVAAYSCCTRPPSKTQACGERLAVAIADLEVAMSRWRRVGTPLAGVARRAGRLAVLTACAAPTQRVATDSETGTSLHCPPLPVPQKAKRRSCEHDKIAFSRLWGQRQPVICDGHLSPQQSSELAGHARPPSVGIPALGRPQEPGYPHPQSTL